MWEELSGAIMRWLHVLVGIMWIGLLYYFNFVNVEAAKQANAAGEGAASAFAWAPMVLTTVRPEVKVEPAPVPSIGTRPRESRAGSPLLARHVNTL